MACSSSGGSEVPGPDKKGAVGSACAGQGDCGSGQSCITDKTFPGGYCYKDCADDPTCPEGATCSEYLDFSWCFANCDKDEDCREEYHCEYSVCRPGCSNDRPCRGEDTCRDGRCLPPCKVDEDCPKGRCQDGECLPPCAGDQDCLPGFTCDTASGRCKAKPGAAMGEACTASSQCATGYCLPTTKICSIKCQGPAECPKGYACGLEKLDQDGNGIFDNAEADCVPAVGDKTAGELCTKDDDCASGHCYDGFCMEGCAADADCAAASPPSPMRCTEVRLLVGGGIPTYRGCLPANGASQNYVVGTVKPGGLLGIDIPPGAASFILSTEAPAGEIAMVAMVTDPSNEPVVDANETVDPCKFYEQRNRYYPAMELASLYYPNTPSVKLQPGMHTFHFTGTKNDMSIKVMLSLKMGQATKGTLNVNWHFLNLYNTCIPQPRLDAGSAPTHPWFSKLVASMEKILGAANVKLGQQTYTNINDSTLDVITVSDTGPSPELDKLFASSKAQSNAAVDIFLVREISAGGFSGGIVLGISGGIPGPPGIHGSIHSGAALSVTTACFEKYGYNPGHTLAHEIGHYLGLFHNQETNTNPGYDESSGDVLCPCPCGPNLTCENTYQGQWCRGLDHIPDTQTENSNLMYWAAENTQDFSGNQLSPGQVRVVLDNPLVGNE